MIGRQHVKRLLESFIHRQHLYLLRRDMDWQNKGGVTPKRGRYGDRSGCYRAPHCRGSESDDISRYHRGGGENGMKKEEAVENLERAGETISGFYVRAWDNALHPTEVGWATSIASMAAIPVLSAASIGQMVSAAVVKQVSPNVFDTISNFGKPKK